MAQLFPKAHSRSSTPNVSKGPGALAIPTADGQFGCTAPADYRHRDQSADSRLDGVASASTFVVTRWSDTELLLFIQSLRLRCLAEMALAHTHWGRKRRPRIAVAIYSRTAGSSRTNGRNTAYRDDGKSYVKDHLYVQMGSAPRVLARYP